MEFSWDSANIEHIARHDIAPSEIEQVIANHPVDAGVVLRNGEMRTINLGATDSGRILFVVVAMRGELYRVVTARPANRKERAFYANNKVATNDKDPTDT